MKCVEFRRCTIGFINPPISNMHVYIFPMKILTRKDILFTMNDITKREYTEKGSILFTHVIYA